MHTIITMYWILTTRLKFMITLIKQGHLGMIIVKMKALIIILWINSKVQKWILQIGN